VVRDEEMRYQSFIINVTADFLETQAELLFESSALHEVCHIVNDDLTGYHRNGANAEAAEESCVLHAVGDLLRIRDRPTIVTQLEDLGAQRQAHAVAGAAVLVDGDPHQRPRASTTSNTKTKRTPRSTTRSRSTAATSPISTSPPTSCTPAWSATPC